MWIFFFDIISSVSCCLSAMSLAITLLVVVVFLLSWTYWSMDGGKSMAWTPGFFVFWI